jgi:hypothetical protein
MYKLEPTSDAHRRAMATSYIGEHVLDLAVAAQPAEVSEALPDRYGIPLLEFLLVDPGYVFVSWEVTPEQIDQAHNALGDEGFGKRRLKIRFREFTPDGEIFHIQELFGDAGRWFLALFRPAVNVYAELGFQSGQEFFCLTRTGPLRMPRVETLEPETFDELKVSYGFGQHGRLLLLGIDRARNAAWPGITLPRPAPEDYTHHILAAPGSAEEGLSSKLPGSLGLAIGVPSSAGVSSFTQAVSSGGRKDD